MSGNRGNGISMSCYLVVTSLLTSKSKPYGRFDIQGEIKYLNFDLKVKQLIENLFFFKEYKTVPTLLSE